MYNRTPFRPFNGQPEAESTPGITRDSTEITVPAWLRTLGTALGPLVRWAVDLGVLLLASVMLTCGCLLLLIARGWVAFITVPMLAMGDRLLQQLTHRRTQLVVVQHLSARVLRRMLGEKAPTAVHLSPDKIQTPAPPGPYA